MWNTVYFSTILLFILALSDIVLLKSTVHFKSKLAKRRYNILNNILISFEHKMVPLNAESRIVEISVSVNAFIRDARNIFMCKEMRAQVLRQSSSA